MRRHLQIGEVARLLGISTKTIRHYQRIGLLAEPARSAGGYRLFGGEDLLALLRIRRLTALGLPLSRIREALATPENRGPLRRALEELREELAVEMQSLTARQAEVDRLLGEEGFGELGEPAPPPAEVEKTLARVRSQLSGQFTGVDPAVLDRAFALDRRLLGLLYELKLPAATRENLRETLGRLAADPALLSPLLPLLARWVALGEGAGLGELEEPPQVEALAREIAAALPLELTPRAAAAEPGTGDLSEILAELARGALPPAQGRVLARLREHLQERRENRAPENKRGTGPTALK